MKKWIKITLIAAAVLAVLIVIAAIAVSPVAKNYIEKHDRELIGRSIRMERLRMNIFTGRLRIEGLRIGGSEDSTTFFRLDSFEMRMRLWPLLGNRVLVKKISFAGPDVKIYQRGNAFSFDDITARFAGDTTAAATPEKPSKPWEIGIYDISIRNGRVFYKDLALDAEWGMNDINLHIPGVYFSGEKTDVGAVLNFAEGGSLSTDVGSKARNSTSEYACRTSRWRARCPISGSRSTSRPWTAACRPTSACAATRNTCFRSRPRVRLRWRASPCATGSSGPWRASIRWV